MEYVGAEGEGSTTTVGSSGAVCDVPEGTGEVECTAGEAPGSECTFECTDEVGQTFTSSCSKTGCRCFYQNAIACTCAFHEPHADCGGPSCCPSPWR